jgi:hypothetical protein
VQCRGLRAVGLGMGGGVAQVLSARIAAKAAPTVHSRLKPLPQFIRG